MHEAAFQVQFKVPLQKIQKLIAKYLFCYQLWFQGITWRFIISVPRLHPTETIQSNNLPDYYCCRLSLIGTQWAFKCLNAALNAPASLTWFYFVKSCSLHHLHQQPTKNTKAKQTMSPQRSLMDTIHIEIYLKNNYILYIAKYFILSPLLLLFHCCFVLIWVFILACSHSNSLSRRVKYLFCGYQSGDEEHRSRPHCHCHRHCTALSFGSSVALGVMWLLPSWLKMNQ